MNVDLLEPAEAEMQEAISYYDTERTDCDAWSDADPEYNQSMTQLPDFDPTLFAGTDFFAQSSSPCLYDATQAWHIGFRWEEVQGPPKANETYVRRVLDRECWDDDSDGHYDETCGGDDCDDADSDTYPGALESCDGKDNDCDGTVPSDEEDADGDGYVICENGWLSTTGVIGESHVYALLETSNGYIYAGSFPGGDISRTSDGGATWTPTQQHVPNANAVYDLIEASDGYIYAGVSDTSEPDGEVFRTGDGGATWEPTADLNGATTVNCLLEASDGALYAGTYPYADVFRTDDGGVTWINTAEISGAIIIESLEEGADGTLYAGTGNNIRAYKWMLRRSLPCPCTCLEVLEELTARQEERHALGLHLDRFVGPRIAAHPGPVLANGEGAEVSHLHPVALVQGFDHSREKDLFTHSGGARSSHRGEV